MKHSETAFCFRRGDGPGYALRWFTPTSEVASAWREKAKKRSLVKILVSLLTCGRVYRALDARCAVCGHATLAAAAALLEDGGTVLPISFHTKSGELRVSRDKGGVMLVISLPACPPVECPSATGVELSASLAAALRCPPPLWIGRSEGLGDIVAILPTEADVRAAAPDEALVKALGGRGVVITSLGDAGASHDVVSRCFYPNVGILEDPVTGSAHAAIAPLWEARLGHSSLRCAQASARGGELRASMERDGFVELAGAHITVVRGELCVKL